MAERQLRHILITCTRGFRATAPVIACSVCECGSGCYELFLSFEVRLWVLVRGVIVTTTPEQCRCLWHNHCITLTLPLIYCQSTSDVTLSCFLDPSSSLVRLFVRSLCVSQSACLLLWFGYFTLPSRLTSGVCCMLDQCLVLLAKTPESSVAQQLCSCISVAKAAASSLYAINNA